MADANALDCVVFDIDDTLYLERDYVRSGFAAVAAWLDETRCISGFFEAAWGAFEDGVRGNTFDLALTACGAEPAPALVAELVDVYRSHRPDISLLDDARSCLDRMRGNVRVAVISDGPLASQRAKAAALGADDWADLVVLTSDLGEGFGKPHCRAFELVEERTGSSGARCAYVADNPAKDFGGPRSLGWRTVRVRRPESLHRDVASGDDVDVEIATLDHFTLS